MKLSPYLGFNGQCREAFQFYNEVFGGQIVHMITNGDVPTADQMPLDGQDMIMHARLVVGDVVIMGGDTPPSFYKPPAGLFVSMIVDGAEEAERIFAKLSEGGRVTMPMTETFFSMRFGMVFDMYGTPWMINGGEKPI